MDPSCLCGSRSFLESNYIAEWDHYCQREDRVWSCLEAGPEDEGRTYYEMHCCDGADPDYPPSCVCGDKPFLQGHELGNSIAGFYTCEEELMSWACKSDEGLREYMSQLCCDGGQEEEEDYGCVKTCSEDCLNEYYEEQGRAALTPPAQPRSPQPTPAALTPPSAPPTHSGPLLRAS